MRKWETLVFASGLAMVTAMSWTILASYTPGYKDEQWMFLQHWPTLPLLWWQHSEHRLPFAKLLGLLDVWFFGANNRFLLTLIFLTQALHALLIGGLGRGREPVGLFGLALFFCFQPAQWENFTWGFQIQFVMAYLAGTAAFVSAIRYLEMLDRRWLVAAIGAAGFATFDLASGILLWPLLIALLLWQRRLHEAVLVGSCAVLALAVFFWGWHVVGYHGDPVQNISAMRAWLAYTLRYFGHSWSVTGLSGGRVDILAAVGILVFAALAVQTPRAKPSDSVPLWMGLFALGTAVVTALGRLRFGPEQAMTSRYQTPAMLFWCALALMAWRSARWRPAVSLLVATAAVLTCLHLEAVTAGAYRWQHRIDGALASFYSGLFVDDDLAQFGLDPAIVRTAWPEARARGWMGFPATPPVVDSHVIDRCDGRQEVIAAVDGPGGSGWRISGRVNGIRHLQGFGAVQQLRPDGENGFVLYKRHVDEPVVGERWNGSPCRIEGNPTNANQVIRIDSTQATGLLASATPLWLPGDPPGTVHNAISRLDTDVLTLRATNGDPYVEVRLRADARSFTSLLLDVDFAALDEIEYYFGYGAGQNGGHWVRGVHGRTLVLIHGSQNRQWKQSAGRFLRVDPGGTGVIGKTTKIYGIYGLKGSEPAGLPEAQFLMLK